MKENVMNTSTKQTLGRGSKEILADLGVEIKSEKTPAGYISQEILAASAIKDIVEIIQDINSEYHKIIFHSVIEILEIKNKNEVRPWVVEDKSISINSEKKGWWKR